jgi:hypothetical protein
MRHPQLTSALISPLREPENADLSWDANTSAQRILGPVLRYQVNNQTTSP